MVKVVYCFDTSSMVDLPKTHFQIQTDKTSCFNQAFYGLLYLGKWIGVFLGSGIELMKVNAKTQTSFLHTSITALHYGLWLGQIAPTSNISFTYALTSNTIGGGFLGTSPWRVHHQQLWPLVALHLDSPILQAPGKKCHDTQLTWFRQLPDFCLTTCLGQTNPAAERAILSSAQPSP